MDNVEIIRGDTKTISVPIVDINDEPIDMSNIKELYLTCRKQTSKQSPVIFEKKKEDFIFEENLYKVELNTSDTEKLNLSTCYFDIEVTLIDGTRKTKLCQMNVKADCTIHEGDVVNGN